MPRVDGTSHLDKLSTIEMIDVELPTTNGQEIILSRYTEPEGDVTLLLKRDGIAAARPIPAAHPGCLLQPHVVPTFSTSTLKKQDL